MRLGFDIHGVLDTFDIFQKIVNKYADDPEVEIHVLSGLESKYLEEQLGHLIDLNKVQFFSVTDYLVETGKKVQWVDDMPWADEEEWNMAKATYCQANKIDILYDDSPVYASYFNNIDTIYCQVHNPNRKQFKTR